MKPDPECALTVIVPAYKRRFLHDALNGFASQTDQRFNLNVGDDASPDDIKSICDSFAGRLKCFYHRFDNNMGRATLAGHWARCVRLSSEPWVWLFSDDDVTAPNCVENFHHYLQSGDASARLLHFDVDVIDGNGKVLRRPEPYGPFLTSEQWRGAKAKSTLPAQVRAIGARMSRLPLPTYAGCLKTMQSEW